MHRIFLPTIIVYFLSTPAFAGKCEDAEKESGWDGLDASEKIEMITAEETESQTFNPTEFKDQKTLAEIAKYALENVEKEKIQDDLYEKRSIFTIGEITVEEVTTHYVQGKLVALGLRLAQDGGSTKNGSKPPKKHYATAEEAKADGMQIVGADVSWDVLTIFEWNGKKWKPLTLDAIGEGGMSWSGF